MNPDNNNEDVPEITVHVLTPEQLEHYFSTGELPDPTGGRKHYDETNRDDRLAACEAALNALAKTLESKDPAAYEAMWNWTIDEPTFARDLIFTIRAAATALKTNG